MAWFKDRLGKVGRSLRAAWSKPRISRTTGEPRSLIPRRTAIVALSGTAVGLVSLLGGRVVCSAMDPEETAEAEVLPFAFEPEDAISIGAAYAAQQSMGVSSVRQALGAKLMPHMMTQLTLAGAARGAISDDLAKGNMVLVDRWLIAETEAQLCCLVAGRLA
jgi:hypothetical protein